VAKFYDGPRSRRFDDFGPLRGTISRFSSGVGRSNAKDEIEFDYCADRTCVRLQARNSLAGLACLFQHNHRKGGRLSKHLDKISTDRPDVTNSSLVVPAGSLQIENGVNFSARDGDRFVDGTNTRLRTGIASCLEFLVDTPTYFANVRGPKSSGFSDVAPALKWQISPVPGKVDLSAVFGVALPTGSASIAGRGAQPYLQFPWSWELRSG
jgi:hypothetical protein